MLSNVELNLHDSNGGAGSGTGTGIFGKVGVSLWRVRVLS